ncbi:hypothetical protein MJO28_015556 [Puccinia striiformis f. sp. tritici]|uniref:Uncharacterized protein n=1 Tax=Puccinia striiformis f. sp. tritici TaxID=168172 RepID=A0ACC0DQ39_9BASI|nr:hypothetical protein MJO29_015810 [Puccinia striiformis f. sp. tritici]KAI7936657.1 hypothetical protein MJO28_015556 [Puccinia striiformis f. sp. tritici]
MVISCRRVGNNRWNQNSQKARLVNLTEPSKTSSQHPSSKPHSSDINYIEDYRANFDCGHLAAACPKSGTPSCYNCGGEGHISKDCSNPTAPKSCYNCGDSGHISRDCSQSQKAKCFKCGEEGHYSRDCTSSGGAEQGQQSYSGGRSRGGFSARNCYTCGGVGHLSRDCVGDQKCFNCGEVGHVSRDCSRPQAKNCYSVSIIKIFHTSMKESINNPVNPFPSQHLFKKWWIPSVI